MFCKKCGAKNLEQSKFCKGCGALIDNITQNVSTDNNKTISNDKQKTALDFIVAVFKKYAVFKGRAQRAEYWYFYLFTMVVDFVGAILFYALAGATSYAIILYLGFLFLVLFTLAVIIPSLAVTMRRLHDVGKSGAMILINFIPLVGPIWFLILILTDSDPGKNRYGSNPKGIDII